MSDQRISPPILNDLPAEVDQLGFEPYVRTLADIILDPGTQTPLTLGVFGSWGSGKTSMLRMLRARIDERPAKEQESFPIQTIWFNAWMYNREEALWRAFLLQVLGGVRDLVKGHREPNRDLDRIAAQLTAGAGPSSAPFVSLQGEQVALPGAQVNLPLLTGLRMLQTISSLAHAPTAEDRASLALLVDKVETAEARVRQDRIAALDDFRRTLEQVSTRYVRDRARLVVFVDDLDRCLSEKGLEVLEAIKLFLDVEGWVFVLGLDYMAVESAVRRRYPGEVKAQYLDKIIQVPFNLPPIEAESMRSYVQSLAPSLPDPKCVEVFAVGLGSNPRQVKRILNVFLLLSRLCEGSEELQKAIQPVRLAKFVAIQHVYRDLYDLIQQKPEYLSVLDAYFRETPYGEPPGEIGDMKPALPDELAPFDKPDLARLFLSVDAEDATFVGQKSDDLRPYITLTRRAAPGETSASSAVQATLEPEMVLVPGGEFPMGTDDLQVNTLVRLYDWAKTAKQKDRFDQEQPVKRVFIDAFEIGRYPVLNVEYAEFVRSTGAPAPPHWPGGTLPDELADHPVVNVTWHDALAYVQWLEKRTGKSYRLPSETEWEKAAGWDPVKEYKRIWPWGDEWNPQLLNWRSTGLRRTTPRGQFSPDGDSPHGCADMVGNVWEWCSSLWGSDPSNPLPYPYKADDNREDLTRGGYRIVRGGSWYNNDPAVLRCASRGRNDPGLKGPSVGFRVARSLPK